MPQSTLHRFLAPRLRRTGAMAVVGGLAGMAVGIAVLWPMLTRLFEAGRYAGIDFAWPQVRTILLLDIMPPVLTVLVSGAIAAAGYAALTLAATALLPRRHAPLFDGIMLVLSLGMIAEAAGLSRAVTAAGLPPATPALILMAVFWSMSNLIWRQIPLGLPFEDSAGTTLPLPPEAALRALAATYDAPPPAAGTATLDQPAPDRLEVLQTIPGRHGGAVHMAFQLTAAGPGRTDVALKVAASGLSPLTWWDFRTRPFARDYCEYITAELTGARDLSTNGYLMARARRRMARQAA